jgi:hypothetical protein
LSNYDFEVEKTYYLYFSGRQLSDEQIKRVQQNGSDFLARFYVKENHNQTAFRVKRESEALRVTMLYSLPLWIVHLQRLEFELNSSGEMQSPVVLSKVRQLFYTDFFWDILVPTDTKPIFSFDRRSGAISMNDAVSLSSCEAVSNTYLRDGMTFKLDGDGDRTKTERFDFVSLKNRQLIQVGHVITGFESELQPMNGLLSLYLFEGVAAATWSGDLGQAAYKAISKNPLNTTGPTDSAWNAALSRTARQSELVGDIVGAGNAAAISKQLRSGALFSDSIEALLNSEHILSDSALLFVERYGFNLKDPDGLKMAKGKMRLAIDAFAYWWSLGVWGNLTPAAKNPTLDLATDRLLDVLSSMSGEFPSAAPTVLTFADSDGDALTDVEELKLGTDPKRPDWDGDGLWDGWEVKQKIRELGILLPNSDPKVPDLYVQVDWFRGVGETLERRNEINEALKLVVEAFKKPRVGLPNGIALHLQWSDDALQDISPLEVKKLFSDTQWDKLRDRIFPPRKQLTHRHALLALELSSGLEQANGQAFVIDSRINLDGSLESRLEFAARFMRALGQSLGLSRGGFVLEKDSTGGTDLVIDTTPYKPNHLSIMNDAWSSGIRQKDEQGAVTWVLDFQDFDLSMLLNDLSLDETQGLGVVNPASALKGWYTFNRGRDPSFFLNAEGAIDWNLNGDGGNEKGIYEDLNGRIWETKYRATQREWSRLKFSKGRIGSTPLYVNIFESLEPPEEEP